MELTEKNMKELFIECNRLYFNNRLPLPKFGIMESYKALGGIWFNKRSEKTKVLRGQTIYFSKYYVFDDNLARNVMVHEMIHYFLAQKNIVRDGDPDHGKVFMEMAEKINNEHGLCITERQTGKNPPLSDKASKFWYFMSRIF